MGILTIYSKNIKNSTELKCLKGNKVRTFEQLLNNYETGLKFFTEDDVEADIMLLDREEIQRRTNEASKDDLIRLSMLDKKADNIFLSIKNKDGYAIPFLKVIVNITHDSKMVA